MSYCGWCIDKLHDQCIGATRTMNGGLHFCSHPDRNPTLRCVDCSNKTPEEVDPEIWECVDEHRGPQRLRKAAREIANMKTPKSFPQSSPRVAKPRKTTTPGSCLHCGEPTKGGKFLPGHDSRFIQDATRRITEGDLLEDILSEWQDLGVSDALQGKLKKRVNNA